MPDESGGRGTITIIGAGSWGTALSRGLGQSGWRVKLWSRREEIAEAILLNRHNPDYLSEFELPPSVEATADLGEAVAGTAMVALAVPSQGVGEICKRLRPHVAGDWGIVSAAKGLEHETGRRLSLVIGDHLGEGGDRPIAVLSGPNLASEVAAGVATVSVAACADAAFASAVQAALSTPRFRVYTNSDVLGVELGGALKNIIAIGAGISDGLGFGDNAKAALLTRGLAEITRLGVALGARGETFRGLSGMGDMVATCASSKSRNHLVGRELGKGRKLPDILAGMTQIAEGVETTRAARRLAEATQVAMPIAEAVHAVLFEGMEPREAVKSLMTRAWRDELEPESGAQGDDGTG